MEQVQILWVGRSCVGSMAEVKRHSHPYYHLFFVTSGELAVFVREGEHTLRPGQGILIPKEAAHGYVNRNEGSTSYLEIKFAVPAAALDVQLAHIGARPFDEPAAGPLCEQIVQECADLGALADVSATSYLQSLLYVLTRGQRYEKRQEFRYVDVGECSPLSKKIVRYLEEHYAEDVSLDDMAEALGRGKTNLCVTFKKDTQTTIWNCLSLIRIRRAAELIAYGDYTLQQVSGMCGFSTVNHFNRIFLKYVGITPGQCRRAYPPDVLLDPARFKTAEPVNRFLYSVLAQRRINTETMTALEKSTDNAGAGSDQDNT